MRKLLKKTQKVIGPLPESHSPDDLETEGPALATNVGGERWYSSESVRIEFAGPQPLS